MLERSLAGPPQEDSSFDDELPPVAPVTVRRGLAEADPTALTIDALGRQQICRLPEALHAEDPKHSYAARVPPSKIPAIQWRRAPKHHVAHFIETCNNAGTDGDLLVKQFGRSLNGNAFDWYIELPQESIDSWEQLEHEFLSLFYSTRSTVTLVEVANLKQKKGEKVVDYIN
ncbi:hypothetical protein H6P81_006434 [Aristolochia fimbriata]|uniref:Retrotransposon gag domain-containing protein n=1 Tax=Aristolochia fimbriata TaxID=158543 RepID=A0AAV7EXA2_ARIFI|nr:hypothetical protein H6P81_006434 [Aristolochia fimbriata]